VSVEQPAEPLPAGALARFGGVSFRTEAAVDHLAVSPDGRVVACTDRVGKLYLFDAATGRLNRVIHEEAFIAYLAFTPDGRYLASVTGGALVLRDPSSGQRLRRLGGDKN
jgi:WD40 repeat protein